MKTLRSELSDDTDYWAKIKREAPFVAINKSEDAAKQLITLNSLLSTIYFGLISFNDILKQNISLTVLLLFILPLPLWLVSLFFASRVIMPGIYTVNSKEIQSDYTAIGRLKYHHLWWSYTVLIVSIFVLLVNVMVYLIILPPPIP